MSQPPDDPATATVTSLPEEHALLRREVTTRAAAALREADQDRWPARELRELVDYLHLEVLRQIVDEEWLLFRSARHTPDELARLRSDHLELRLSVDTVAQAASSHPSLAPTQLAAVIRDLLTQIDTHLAAEEKILTTAGTPAPSVTSLGAQPHEWYRLTEGPTLDLDQLPGPSGADAALDRLLRLRPGEHVELRSTTDPSPLWQRLRRSDPAGWGIATTEHGPPLWRIGITRRPPEPPLTASPG